MPPIVYDTSLDVRFADLDTYGHVNTTHYMDFVISARFKFVEERFGLSSREFENRGLGFYLRNFSINFRKPIEGQRKIQVISHVENLNGPNFEVPFKILEPQTDKLYSDGRFTCVTIDLKTKRPSNIPEWFVPYFFEIK